MTLETQDLNFDQKLDNLFCKLIPNQIDRSIFVDKVIELIESDFEDTREITRGNVIQYLRDNYCDTISVTHDIDIEDYI